MTRKITIISTFFLFFSSCEENPFSSKSGIPHRKIFGVVNLEGVELYPEGNHSGIFIWSNQLGISDLSGADGSFELELPAASSPNGGGIVDGDYTLYFFMANYEVSTVEVTFAGGEILNDDRVIKIDGELRKRINLKRMVQINTEVQPSTFPTDFEEDVKVLINATPDRSDIFFYLKGIEIPRMGTIYSGLLIKDASSGELVLSFNPDTANTIKRVIDKPYREFLINFEVIDDSLGSALPPGSYEAVPYIIVESNDMVPTHLLEALGSDYNEFSEKYFRYPMYRTGGKFTITE
tara:strand:+ start:273 stop:1151 length:879 start_codon:yes stop_codon:yes gene_type:complete